MCVICLLFVVVCMSIVCLCVVLFVLLVAIVVLYGCDARCRVMRMLRCWCSVFLVVVLMPSVCYCRNRMSMLCSLYVGYWL